MSNNDSSAEDYIDWENFTAVGQDVGPIYQSMTSETDRAEFRKGFLIGFSQSFTGTGADASKLSNWTVVSESPSGTVVSAKAPNGNKLLITVTKRNELGHVATVAMTRPARMAMAAGTTAGRRTPGCRMSCRS